jgi:Putative MetA-pathway of phenol degradation
MSLASEMSTYNPFKKSGGRCRKWTWWRVYAFHAPTGLYIPQASGSIGHGQWTHEFSLGGMVYFGHAKTWSVSTLASYDLNQRKEGIDITRGDTFQFQGWRRQDLSPARQDSPKCEYRRGRIWIVASAGRSRGRSSRSSSRRPRPGPWGGARTRFHSRSDPQPDYRALLPRHCG